MSKQHECVNCSKIEALYLQISKLSDLSPSENVNKLFSELVALAIVDTDKHIMSEDKIEHLQKICSLSEFELEKYWANKIINSKNPKKYLSLFPYYQNYLDLTKLEYFSIKGCSDHEVNNYLFIGGGPLPMTAIILAIEYGAKVTILDFDLEACGLSTKLISKIGLDKKIKIINQDGSKFENYVDFDIIFVAALAGTDSEVKSNILQQINNFSKKNTLILARSAWGNRKLLYKSLDKKIYKMFTPIIEVHPQNHIVNSVIVMKT